jgi:hypothetical protein
MKARRRLPPIHQRWSVWDHLKNHWVQMGPKRHHRPWICDYFAAYDFENAHGPKRFQAIPLGGARP